MAEYKLTDEIIKASQANNWAAAKVEWKLKEIYMADDPDVCLCGHSPIREICVIINKINGNEAIVGNSCVKKFMDLTSDIIFQAYKKIKNDNEKSLNLEAIKYALKVGWISNWDYNFYENIWRKRNLSNSQMIQKKRINNIFLNKFRK